MMDTGRSLLGNTLDSGEHLRVLFVNEGSKITTYISIEDPMRL